MLNEQYFFNNLSLRKARSVSGPITGESGSGLVPTFNGNR